MCEDVIVDAFTGVSHDELLELSRNITLLEKDLDNLRRACHNVWDASFKAFEASLDEEYPDRARELNEIAVKKAWVAKAVAKKARAQMGILNLNLELYEL